LWRAHWEGADAGRLFYELLVGKDGGGFISARVDPASGRVSDEERRPLAGCIVHPGVGVHGAATDRTGQGLAMGTGPPPDPTRGDRKRPIAVGVFLALLVVLLLLLLLVLRALGLWGSGEMA
jgi:hypothetical protein